MCPQLDETNHSSINPKVWTPLAVIVGLISGLSGFDWLYQLASVISQIFINCLKLVSLPIIFLSIISTATGMESLQEVKHLGKRVLKYTLLTTLIAGFVAFFVFLMINPVRQGVLESSVSSVEIKKSYIDYLIGVIPSNIVQPFAENNVVGVLLIAMLLSFAMLALPESNRKDLHAFFSNLYAAVMKVTSWLILVLPLGIWAFITLFLKEMKNGLEFKRLALYLACVLIANLIQALVVLPLFLKGKGIAPWKTLKAMYPALSVAFFTKSSSAALPMAIKCAEKNVGISKKIAGFSLPLCTTINMNACAAFIFITVMFVSMSHGMTYSLAEMILWVFIATIAAVGNAGVPMGCYFLSSALLAAMNVPLYILGIILPFYSIIDMLESAINVWSDSCVTAVVDKEVGETAFKAVEAV